MQKSFCDICGKEITKGMLPGGIMRNVERYPVIPMPGKEGGMGSMIGKQIVPEIWELCPDCYKPLWDIAEKRRTELTGKKQESISKPGSTLIKP